MSNVKGAVVKPSQALNLDVNQQKKFLEFFKTLGKKPVSTVRFFDRNDYYSLHGEDAHLAARIVFKSTATVKRMEPKGETGLDYVSLSKGNFEILIRELLLVKNYRIEVFTRKGQSNDWCVEFKGSPGNLIQFENLLFNNTEMVVGSSIIAVNMKQSGQQKAIGVACVEQNERKLSVIEFEDNDFFAELEATVVLLGPKEAILPSNDGEYERIAQLLERNNVMVTVRKKKDFVVSDNGDLVQDLNHLLHFKKGQQENSNSLPEMKLTLAMASLNAAIKYLDLASDSCNMGHFTVETMNLNRFVHLDAAAVSALNLLPKPGTSIASSAYRWQSILGVLDRCQTPQGHRLMAQWIKQPLREEELIKERHSIVECFVDASTARTSLYEDHLKRLPDILMLGKKLQRKRATLQDIYRLYQVTVRVPKILAALQELECVTIEKNICEALKDVLGELNNFRQMVESIIDNDSIENGEFLVRASFDPELEKLKDVMDKFESKMQKERKRATDDLNCDAKLEYVSHLGYHFRITLKEEPCLRGKKKYSIFDALKGGVRFTSDILKDLNEEYAEAKEQYEQQQESIVQEIIRVALGYLGSFTRMNNIIAEIDCFLSFAIAAVSAPTPYVKPTMSDGTPRILNLKGMRHPCLELQNDVTFIANDIHFQDEETNMYIITGPNMGGKSTYIRSVGAAVLMAHIGSFVACDEAEIPYVDCILGRIGADDNINKGLSTFMVEMIETSGIIRTATAKSLVVIDELGRGTSTYEGCGIAWAIAEHLAKETKCFTLFATHFHEITDLANTLKNVKNSHMVAVSDKDTFTLLYQVKAGVMDKSFGIHVAKLANFPSEVVDLAQKTYDESEDHYGQLQSSQDGQQSAKIFTDAIEMLMKFDANTVNDGEIKKAMEKIRGDVKGSGNAYLKESFPQLFA